MRKDMPRICDELIATVVCRVTSHEELTKIPASGGEDVYQWKPEQWMSALPDSVAQAHFPGNPGYIRTCGCEVVRRFPVV